MSGAPRNTAAEARSNPLTVLAASSGPGGFTQAITEQERNGQAELVASSVLPTNMSPGDVAFMQLGFVFGDLVPGDPLFRKVTLPPGWSIVPGEDSRQTYVIDDRGIRRVSVFYKAAFYDRKADMHLLDVGSDLALEAVYGDGPVTEVLHPDLTRRELAALRRAIARHLEEQDPEQARDRARARRAEALLREIDSRFARSRRRRGGRRDRARGRTHS